jgi:putative ABC transport system permease protein
LDDLRYALKSLARSRGFTLIAIVTLALGIGANTAAFSILNALLLRPLPYADSGRLDRIYRSIAQSPRGGVSPADYLDLKPQTGGYGEVAAYGASEMILSEPGQPAEMVSGLRVSSNLFSTLATAPSLGRDFRPDEEIQATTVSSSSATAAGGTASPRTPG